MGLLQNLSAGRVSHSSWFSPILEDRIPELYQYCQPRIVLTKFILNIAGNSFLPLLCTFISSWGHIVTVAQWNWAWETLVLYGTPLELAIRWKSRISVRCLNYNIINARHISKELWFGDIMWPWSILMLLGEHTRHGAHRPFLSCERTYQTQIQPEAWRKVGAVHQFYSVLFAVSARRHEPF